LRVLKQLLFPDFLCQDIILETFNSIFAIPPA
jgi:hypothetical protein